MQKEKNKTVYLYDIGRGMTLMNILTKNADDQLDRVETYIGVENYAFSEVGTVRDLASSGTVFRYSSYVREQEAMLDVYIEMFEKNTGLRIRKTPDGKIIATSLDGNHVMALPVD